MRIHELKCWPEPFEAVRLGVKRYEIRKDDGRGFAVGDLLRLEEWTPEEDPTYGEYTGASVLMFVSYLTRGLWGLPPDLVVMSIRRVLERR